MARKLRIEYPGAIYHVMNRGDRQEPIFIDETDRERFLHTLGECCAKTKWEIHAYCLMKNHFHLVMETPRANLVAGMKWFLGTYTSRFNRRHRLFGHLFSGRYKALIVDGSGDGYFRTVCHYVHLNPARAKALKPEEPLRSFRWSSFPEYLSKPARRPGWLRVDRLLGELGMPRDSAAGRRQFERAVEEVRRLDEPDLWKGIERGWFLGDEEFRQELLEQMSTRMGRHHGGEERQETETARAERLVLEELKQRGWREKDLADRRRGDREKVRMATRLRQETTMTLEWVANRLQMGSVGYTANCLRQFRKR
jgi:REP element-mobilizing transposase RayT